MPTITYPLMTVTDDSGAIVAGATVSIASVKDKAGTDIATPGATVNQSGANVSLDYDAETKGEAWVVLAISKVGSTFTGTNAAPAFYLARDSGRLLTALPTIAPATSGGLPTVGTGSGQIALASGAVTAGTVGDKSGYSLSGTQVFNVTGNVTGNLTGSVGSVTGAVGSVAGNVVGSVGSIAASGINLASFAADTQSDGTAQASPTPTTTTFNFDAADSQANAIAGAWNRYVAIVAGTGIGQVMPIASIAGSSGSKVGTLATGYAWDAAAIPDGTSKYVVGGPFQASIASTLTAADVVDAMDADSAKLGQIAGAFSGSTSVFTADALANAPGGAIDLATGVVVGTPTTTSIAISGTNLLGASGDYNGRRLYINAGTRATYLTDPCAAHTVVGSGISAVHTFAFTNAQRLVVAGDVAAVVGV